MATLLRGYFSQVANCLQLKAFYMQTSESQRLLQVNV